MGGNREVLGIVHGGSSLRLADDPVDQPRQRGEGVDIGDLELHVGQGDVERLALPVVEREGDAEAQAGAVFERGELPAVAVQVDRGEQEVRGDLDVGGEVELELGLGPDLPLGVERQPLGRAPFDGHVSLGGALDAELGAHLQPGFGADDGDADAHAALHEEAQAGVGRDVELGMAGDGRLLLVRRVVGDLQAQVAELPRPDARAGLEAAADGGEDADALAGHRHADERDVDVDAEDLLLQLLLREDVEGRGEADLARDLDLAVGEELDAGGPLQPGSDLDRGKAGAERRHRLRRRAGGLAVVAHRAVGDAERDAPLEHPLFEGDRALRGEGAVVVVDVDRGGQAVEADGRVAMGLDHVVGAPRPGLHRGFDRSALDQRVVGRELEGAAGLDPDGRVVLDHQRGLLDSPHVGLDRALGLPDVAVDGDLDGGRLDALELAGLDAQLPLAAELLVAVPDLDLGRREEVRLEFELALQAEAFGGGAEAGELAVAQLLDVEEDVADDLQTLGADVDGQARIRHLDRAGEGELAEADDPLVRVELDLVHGDGAQARGLERLLGGFPEARVGDHSAVFDGVDLAQVQTGERGLLEDLGLGVAEDCAADLAALSFGVGEAFDGEVAELDGAFELSALVQVRDAQTAAGLAGVDGELVRLSLQPGGLDLLLGQGGERLDLLARLDLAQAPGGRSARGLQASDDFFGGDRVGAADRIDRGGALGPYRAGRGVDELLDAGVLLVLDVAAGGLVGLGLQHPQVAGVVRAAELQLELVVDVVEQPVAVLVPERPQGALADGLLVADDVVLVALELQIVDGFAVLGQAGGLALGELGVELGVEPGARLGLLLPDLALRVFPRLVGL